MLSEVIDKLDLRRLKDCSPRQRVAARGLAEHLREVRSEVTAARAWEALRAAESQGRDPLTRAGELLEQIKLERDSRQQITSSTTAIRRSRRSELAPARIAAALIWELLPGAHGPELDALKHQAQQLEQSPPVSEAERRKGIAALQAKEINVARMLNPYN